MIYLDNAATTFPKPSCLSDEITRCIKTYCGNPGRSAHALSIKSSEKIYEARELLATMFGASAENVIFTYNTTYALNLAIKSLYKRGGHILISDIEHNSVYRPVFNLLKQGLCTFDIFSTSGNESEILENIKSKLIPSTSMIVCTHTSNICERTLPISLIGKLCKEKGITFIVDGAQSAGIKQINVQDMNISALCIPAHKGLYGPQGLGMIIFGEHKLERTIIEGGTGINSKELEMPDFLPEALEGGTMSTPLIAGLCESLKWLKNTDANHICAYEEELYKILVEHLSEIKSLKLYKLNSYSGNTVIFNLDGMPSNTVGAELNKRGVCVRSGFHCSPLAHSTAKTGENGAVRISLGAFNTKNDIYGVCNAINNISKRVKY